MMSRSHSRGFTLVEVSIAVLVLALSAGVVISTTGRSVAELRESTGKLSGTIRASYDSAALSGQTWRLAFDFEANKITVEATEERINFGGNGNILAVGAAAGSSGGGGLAQLMMGMGGGMGGMGDEESESTAIEPGEGALPGALSALFGINQAFEEGEQQVAFSPTGQELILPEGIKIMDVWIEGMGEAEHEGKAELYFFPHGYTQHAYIHLESSNGVIYTISVAPLTGKVKIFDYFKEAPE